MVWYKVVLYLQWQARRKSYMIYVNVNVNLYSTSSQKITPFGAIFSDLELPLTQIVSSACHYLMPNSTR